MFITESKIREIISEELEALLQEERLDEIDWKKIGKKAVGTAAGIAALAGAHNIGSRSGSEGIPRDNAVAGVTGKADVAGEKHRPEPKLDRIRKDTVAKKASKSDSFKDAKKASKQAIVTQADIDINNSNLSTGMKTLAREVYNTEGVLYSAEAERKVLDAIKHANKKRYADDQREIDTQFMHAIGEAFGEDGKLHRMAKQRLRQLYR